MSEIKLSQLIQNSLLISPEMKEHLAAKIISFTDTQQQEMITAIQQSEEDLKQLLNDALKNDEVKLHRVQRKLDEVWKLYIQEIEKTAEAQEEGDQQALLDKLDE
ncbi:MAG: hypothetical protein NTX63_05210 [Candidatus Peregrinibacteria bacterium]|nr:hypothetical protein [Candidatus Peregrinibacteria bacterium]